jgi:urea carboxylase
MVFFKPGDIVQFRSIGREEYESTVAAVEDGMFSPRIRNIEFSLDGFNQDIDGYNHRIQETLYGS